MVSVQILPSTRELRREDESACPWGHSPSFLLLLTFERPLFTCFSKHESDLALSGISLQAYSHIYSLPFSEHPPLCAVSSWEPLLSAQRLFRVSGYRDTSRAGIWL